jgi:hypothetical protein
LDVSTCTLSKLVLVVCALVLLETSVVRDFVETCKVVLLVFVEDVFVVVLFALVVRVVLLAVLVLAVRVNVNTLDIIVTRLGV